MTVIESCIAPIGTHSLLPQGQRLAHSGACTTSAGQSAQEFLASVVSVLSPRTAQMTDALLRRIRIEIPELCEDGSIGALLKAGTAHIVVAALHAVECDLELNRVEAPAAALQYARRLAQRGIGTSPLLRLHQLGLAVLLQRVLSEIHRASADSELTGLASVRVTASLFACTDKMSGQAVAAYEEERERWLRNRALLRSDEVLPVLSRGDVDVPAMEKALSYRLGQRHVGVVAWCGDTTSDGPRRLERLVTELSARVRGDGPPLLTLHDELTMWAWLPSPEQSEDDDPVEWARGVVGGEMWVATGAPARGVEGFRLTHQQALSSYTVASAASAEERGRITTYSRIAPIALMASDIDGLRAWVSTTLGGLAVDNDSCRRLRNTLRVFLSNGGSFTSTAAQLYLHKNTVVYRVRQAAEALGHPLDDGRLHVELALLACHILGSAVLRPVVTTRSGATRG